MDLFWRLILVYLAGWFVTGLWGGILFWGRSTKEVRDSMARQGGPTSGALLSVALIAGMLAGMAWWAFPWPVRIVMLALGKVDGQFGDDE